MDDAAPTVDQAHLSDSSIPESPSDKTPEPTTRPFVQYTRAKLLHLSKSPLVKIPDGMPAFKDWFGEWGESGATSRKDAASDSLSQLARDRTRFRRDTEEGDGTRESLSSGRPTFKNALSFSQASGSAMGSMGSFRHPSSLRLDSDARREEREREREREGRRDTENLRNLSVQFDRERRDREAAPHLPRAASGASSANGRDGKARDQARDSRENTKDSARENRRGRGDDTNDWRRARDDDRQRSRSRPRDRVGRGDREPANGQKRERDSWVAVDDRRGAGGASGRRRGGAIEDRTESKSKDDRGLRNDRDKSTKEEQEPAWMGDYVPETGGQGMLGSGGVEDGIQAWKRELKEKERGAQGGEIEALEDDSLGGLEDEVTHMTLVEKKASHDKPAEDDGLDEIQRFKKLMQESDRKRREEAERNARELAGKFGGQPEPEQSETTNSVADIAVASTLPGPPGLTKSASESLSAPTPPPASDTAASTNGRVGGISLASPNWPMSSSVAPSTTAAVMSPPGWTQSSSPLPDAPQSNPRLSPVQPRRFTQDGNVSQMGNQDGSQVGTRSTSRFANFFGDKQRDPTAPRFNDNPAPNSSHSPSFLPTSNEPQLLDSLLARLAESQTRPQSQTMAQNQDRAFSQRVQAMPSQQPQYGNALGQNPMNTHAQPPLIQHQRQQLSMHQQQQQLLSSLNASNMLPTNASGLQSMSAGGPSSHMSGLNSGVLNPSLNLDVDGRFVSDNLVPGLRPRNGSVAFDEDFQVNSGGGMGRMPIQQHRPQQSFDALHGRPQPQQTMYNVGNRTPSGGYRNGPSPIGGHNPNPMQRGPDLPQYLAGMAGPLGGAGAGNTTGPQQQYSNRLGAMANLGGMLGAGGPANQPRFDERQRMQQSQNAPMHHQPGQSLSGMGGLPLDFGVLQQQQQPSQRQMPRVGGYGMQQTQAPMGPRSTSGHHGQYPGHMHNDFVVQPNQGANTNDIMAMFLASQGNNGMGA